MLLQFSVKNFKSFNDKATLSLIATNYDKETREEDNIHYDQQFGLRILKSAVVYGANGSGKSTLLEALGFMKYLVISSSKESQQGDEIDVEPFKLNDESDELPSEFEAIFIHNNKIYRYGFEVNKL
ncbi:MAG: AAA family ATPase, partial [Chryseobacterium sp.]|nr:AAA family ATPase [Chryseobacterium sp.]